MENIFRPGKWFVLFCGMFIILWGVLQYVSNARLKEEATMIGAGIFTWSWPGGDFASKGQITDASVVQKNANDAVVKIKGKQSFGPESTIASNPEVVDVEATLYFYKTSIDNKDYWMLGKVELP
jgi:hypothetical protein